MQTNPLLQILDIIRSKAIENASLEAIRSKLVGWNELMEQEWTSDQPKLKWSSFEDNDSVNITTISTEIQIELLKNILKYNPEIYSRKKIVSNERLRYDDNNNTTIVWNESASLVIPSHNLNTDWNALASRITTCISVRTNDGDVLSDDVNQHLEYITHLIRACKNIIRYNRMLWSNHKQQSSSDGDFFLRNSTSQLCTSGMIHLYLTLLYVNSQYECNSNHVVSSISSDHAANHDHTIRDDLARQAATILFHATFAHSEEPYCRKALKSLISREMNGPMILSELLMRPNPVFVVLPLMKNVHNMMSVYPIIISEMDSAFHRMHPMEQGTTRPWNLLTILITTLAWCIHSTPTFPGPTKDRRVDLSIEILRILFAMRNVLGRNQDKDMKQDNTEIMTYLLNLLVHIFHLDHRDRRVYDCKLSALMLFMDSPEDWNSIILKYRVVEQLNLIFWYQLNEYVVEQADNVPSEKNSTTMLPILLVLNRLCQDIKIREQVKRFIFPSDDESTFVNKSNEPTSEKNMHPLDAPKGTTRFKLINLMTCTETNLKRCSSELMWTLCDRDSKEFILRCGFGNAVHQLGIKGMYSLPK